MAPGGGGWGLFFWKKWPQGIDFFKKVAPPPPPGAIFEKVEKNPKRLNCSGKCKNGLKKCNFKPNSVKKKKISKIIWHSINLAERIQIPAKFSQKNILFLVEKILEKNGPRGGGVGTIFLEKMAPGDRFFQKSGPTPPPWGHF